MTQRTLLRPINAVDFWRGFALISIFINHVPGNFFERFTHRNYSPSDSAELFVFLAGWTLRLGVSKRYGLQTAVQLRQTYGQRAGRVYGLHLCICVIGLAFVTVSAGLLHEAGLLSLLKAGPMFADPVRTGLGLVALTQHLRYFDILPLYVVLLLAAPGLLLTHRHAPGLLLPASLVIYLVTLVYRINVPQWPGPGDWNFNPLTWQFVFVLGFVLAANEGLGALARQHIGVLRAIAWPIILVGAVVVVFDRWPNPARLPEPRLLFMTQKSFATPIRVIDFLALAAVATAYFAAIMRRAPRLVDLLALLGRHSLPVFCVASCLSIIAQIVRYVSPGGGIAVDTLLIGMGVAAMMATAALIERPGWLEARIRKWSGWSLARSKTTKAA